MSILLSNMFMIILVTLVKIFYQLSKLEFVINIFHIFFLISFLIVSYIFISAICF